MYMYDQHEFLLQAEHRLYIITTILKSRLCYNMYLQGTQLSNRRRFQKSSLLIMFFIRKTEGVRGPLAQHQFRITLGQQTASGQLYFLR